ncbi:Bug family tripartite tricarboxylate transporter substrate binding protein [Verticiella sediminum]|nr:tripartite tricarboxylate transporter substrate binding protein [Verticiella sediminum]
MKRAFWLSLALGVAVAAGVSGARAETFPSRALSIIVPVGPGTGADTATRVVGEAVARDLRTPVVVENKPGADTLIGVQALLNAPADGYTVLLLTPSSMVINPVVNAKLPYDPQAIRPLTQVTRGQAALVVGANAPYDDLQSLLAAAKARPGEVSIASYGGHHYRLGNRALERQAGVAFNHVPYNAPSQAVNDVIGRSVDAMLIDLGGALPLIEQGKIKALAVTGVERHPKAPQIPTVRESGLPDYSLYVWIGFGVRADTPEDRIAALEAALRKAVHSDAFTQYTAKQGAGETVGGSGTELHELIVRDTERYRTLVRELGEI